MNEQANNKKRGITPVALLTLTFVLPVVMAVLVYNFESLRPTGMTNHGELVDPPRPLHFNLQDMQGNAFTQENIKGRWTLTVISDGNCGEICQEQIYLMRQVRWSQGDEMNRVQRLLLITKPDSLAGMKDTIDQYPGMFVATGQESSVKALLNEFQHENVQLDKGDRIYIIDPLGNLMMRYAPDSNPNGMIKDLKKLLQFSQFG
jgi:cytochrome oxidase Cu insertion factor (SCO1/SenC/PrrC family)